MWSLTGCELTQQRDHFLHHPIPNHFFSDDSAAHIAEETAGAARAAPIAILVGVAATEILGWLYYIAISYATNSVSGILETKLALPLGQVYLNVLGKKGALALWCSITALQGSAFTGDDHVQLFTFRTVLLWMLTSR
jgi:amino acid transporter